MSLDEAAELLNRLGNASQPGVLLLDGLDEAPRPERVTRSLVELTGLLEGWRVVVTSRTADTGWSAAFFRRYRAFQTLNLQEWSGTDARALINALAPDLSQAAAERLIDISGGNPLLLRLVVEQASARSVGHYARRTPFWPVSGDQIISGDRSDGRRTALRASIMRLSITDPGS